MTLMDHGLASTVHATVQPVVQPTPAIARGFDMRWRSLQPANRTAAIGASSRLVNVEFVVRVELADSNRAMIETWIEREGMRIDCQRRAMHRATVVSDDRYAHVDVFASAGDRILAMSLEQPPLGDEAPRLAYVQTSLPAEAGFTSGRCDRPRLAT